MSLSPHSPPNNVITIISCAAFTENQPVRKINECCHLNTGGIQDLSSLEYRRIKGEAPWGWLHSTWSSWAPGTSRAGDPTTSWSIICPPRWWCFLLLRPSTWLPAAHRSGPLELEGSDLPSPSDVAGCCSASSQATTSYSFAVGHCRKNSLWFFLLSVILWVRCLVPPANGSGGSSSHLGCESRRRAVPCAHLMTGASLWVRLHHLFFSSGYTRPLFLLHPLLLAVQV